MGQDARIVVILRDEIVIVLLIFGRVIAECGRQVLLHKMR
jgi:hypothetical protein